jgi:hypothetical protein
MVALQKSEKTIRNIEWSAAECIYDLSICHPLYEVVFSSRKIAGGAAQRRMTTADQIHVIVPFRLWEDQNRCCGLSWSG